MIRRTGFLASRAIPFRDSWQSIALLAMALVAMITLTCAIETEPVWDMTMLLYPYHAILVSSGLLTLLAGMILARYMKRKKWWLKAHKTLGIAGASLTLAGIGVAVYMVSASSGIQLSGGLHAYVGILALLMVLFTPAIGFIQLKKKDKRLRVVHRWSGRLTLAIMLVNAYLGWSMVQLF